MAADAPPTCSRPTAVNLLDAATKLKALLRTAASAVDATAAAVTTAFIAAAEQMLEDDIAANRAIGGHGVAAVDAALSARKASVNVLTHCNTGSLATAQYGTALGVIRALHEAGRLGHAYCTETRRAPPPHNAQLHNTPWGALQAWRALSQAAPEGVWGYMHCEPRGLEAHGSLKWHPPSPREVTRAAFTMPSACAGPLLPDTCGMRSSE